MKPADRLFLILLAGDISIPDKIKQWLIENLPEEDSEFQTHIEELERGRPYYIHLTSDYKRMNCSQELKDVVKFFVTSVRGKLTDGKEHQFYSVGLKICLDKMVEEHSKQTQRISFTVY